MYTDDLRNCKYEWNEIIADFENSSVYLHKIAIIALFSSRKQKEAPERFFFPRREKKT